VRQKPNEENKMILQAWYLCFANQLLARFFSQKGIGRLLDDAVKCAEWEPSSNKGDDWHCMR